jgi:hypothetical protein
MKSRWKGDTQVVASEPQEYHNPTEFYGKRKKELTAHARSCYGFRV